MARDTRVSNLHSSQEHHPMDNPSRCTLSSLFTLRNILQRKRPSPKSLRYANKSRSTNALSKNSAIASFLFILFQLRLHVTKLLKYAKCSIRLLRVFCVVVPPARRNPYRIRPFGVSAPSRRRRVVSSCA